MRIATSIAALAALAAWSPALAAPGARPPLDPCVASYFGGMAPTASRPQLAVRTTVVCYPSYAALESGVTHGPLWVAEHLKGRDRSPDASAHGANFHEDATVPAGDRASLSDYANGTRYRGRLAAVTTATAPADADDRSSLANVVPVQPGLLKGMWEAIDVAVRDMAAESHGLWIVTGPAFHGRMVEQVGKGVLVPTAIWKAVYDEGTHRSAAYVCTNQNAPQCRIMAVAAITRETGIDPFPAVPAAIKAVVMPLPKPNASPFKDE